jgi:hypothetical protein
VNPNNFGVLQIAISEFGATNKIRNPFFGNQEKSQSKGKDPKEVCFGRHR